MSERCRRRNDARRHVGETGQFRRGIILLGRYAVGGTPGLVGVECILEDAFELHLVLVLDACGCPLPAGDVRGRVGRKCLREHLDVVAALGQRDSDRQSHYAAASGGAWPAAAIISATSMAQPQLMVMPAPACP